jgi:hypothetical protein
MYRAVLTQLLSNPDKAMLAGDKVEEYQKIVNRYEEAADEIEAMKTRLDENGELDEKDYARLQSLLKVPAAIRTGPPKPKPVGDAEKKLPAGFVIQK